MTCKHRHPSTDSESTGDRPGAQSNGQHSRSGAHGFQGAGVDPRAGAAPAPGAGAGGYTLRRPGTYRDGFSDGLEPLRSLDLDRCASVSDLLRELSHTAFGGRDLGEAADVYEAMVRDPDCTVVVTVSGAMTVAKMGRLLSRMIDQGLADLVVSTGALMAHGFVESIGGTHFKYDPAMDDTELYRRGYNRVYDSLELEMNLDDTTALVNDALASWPPDEPVTSHGLHRELGRMLHERGLGPGILPSAYVHRVPVYVPAFTDSELGLDFLYVNEQRRRAGEPTLRFEPFGDLVHLLARFEQASRLGIFTIGGGVPRNWAQQIAPLLDGLITRFGRQAEMKRIQYGVRICPEPAHWGGLSGCSYQEGVSWGKFVPPELGGRFAEVRCDATIGWPILQLGVEQRLRADPPPRLRLAPPPRTGAE
jgi:deoxyhypusine synthase